VSEFRLDPLPGGGALIAISAGVPAEGFLDGLSRVIRQWPGDYPVVLGVDTRRVDLGPLHRMSMRREALQALASFLEEYDVG
jgi:hypothetical protein